MSDRLDVRLAGAGGQGVAFAGKVLAEAALIAGKEAAFSQVYGPESRGGASRADVVIAESSIGYPLTRSLGALVVLTPEAASKFAASLSADGILVADDKAGDADHAFPIIEASRELTGGIVATGVVALGVLEGLSPMVGSDALEEAVAKLAPAKHRAANLAAVARGLEMAAAR